MLDSSLQVRLRKFIYRHRFLALYIAFGFASLWVELVVFRGSARIGLHETPAFILGLASGILFAYWMNVRFNFKVPAPKRRRALVFFVLISLGSGLLNFGFKLQLQHLGWSYETMRFMVSGCLFSIAYTFHRRLTFAEYKRVGVAVYANGIEDIKRIWTKIGMYPDFVHVDLIDRTFNPGAHEVRSHRLETIAAYWPHKPVHAHLMSRKPSAWLPEVLEHADVVFIHLEIDEDIASLVAKIRDAGKEPGLALRMETPVEAARPFIPSVKHLMLLTIAEPGRSGQSFQIEALERIDAVEQWPERPGFSLCIDGGINERNIHLLKVEHVVSGSSVLDADDPQRQIMRLQTSNNYEAI